VLFITEWLGVHVVLEPSGRRSTLERRGISICSETHARGQSPPFAECIHFALSEPTLAAPPDDFVAKGKD
jgi:hypothetical protein